MTHPDKVPGGKESRKCLLQRMRPVCLNPEPFYKFIFKPRPYFRLFLLIKAPAGITEKNGLFSGRKKKAGFQVVRIRCRG